MLVQRNVSKLLPWVLLYRQSEIPEERYPIVNERILDYYSGRGKAVTFDAIRKVI